MTVVPEAPAVWLPHERAGGDGAAGPRRKRAERPVRGDREKRRQ